MIRVGIWGNNFNQGYFLAQLFRRLGASAKAFVVEGALAQDRHEWWTAEALDESLVVRVSGLPDAGARGPLRAREAIRDLHAQAAEFDALVLREDGPALFADLDGVPRVFASQGADLQLWPFWQEVYYSPRAIARQLAASSDGAGPRAGRLWRRAAGLVRSWPSLRRTQGRQRRGIAACARVIVFPYQAPLLDRLGVPRRIVRFVPVPAIEPAASPGEEAAALEGVLAPLPSARVTFLHPARMFFLPEDGNRFLKDNDKLLFAFALYVRAGARGARLVLVEKGRERDLAAAKALVGRLGIAEHVSWLPELPNRVLRRLFTLPNVVVCDQFSPHLPALGNLGREAVQFGLPLVTSYDGTDDAMYSRRPPNVFSGSSVEAIARALEEAARLDAAARTRLKTDCAAWFRDNLDPMKNARRYLDVCVEAMQEGRA